MLSDNVSHLRNNCRQIITNNCKNFSLLAEVSHDEANWNERRDLCRLPTSFLSRMHSRFLNNQWRFCHVRHTPENRFGLVHKRFASWLQYINRGFMILSLLFLPVTHAVRLMNHWFCREEILVNVKNRYLGGHSYCWGGRLKICRSLSGDTQTYRVL